MRLVSGSEAEVCGTEFATYFITQPAVDGPPAQPFFDDKGWEMMGDGGVVASSGGPHNPAYTQNPLHNYAPIHTAQQITGYVPGYPAITQGMYSPDGHYPHPMAMVRLNQHYEAQTQDEPSSSHHGTMVPRANVPPMFVTTPPHPHIPSAKATDPVNNIINCLIYYDTGGEDNEYTRKAIESLVKKLKDRRQELDNLITAITSNGKTPTTCVTIARSLDGRLQVAGRKGVPHVVYARIWRWQNVSKSELQKLPMCQVMVDNQDYICVNPYHYERVVGHPYGAQSPTDEEFGITPLNLIKLQFPGYSTMRIDSAITQQFTAPAPSQQYVRQPSNPQQAPIPMDATDAPYTEWTVAQNYVQPYHPMPITQAPRPVEPAVIACDFTTIRIPPIIVNSFPPNWAYISYYEMDTQIGDPFKWSSERTEVNVDGGMDPQGERNGRFCLGALSNVHRTEASEKARPHIGNGVKLIWTKDEELYMVVQSWKSVFVRSPYLDYCEGLPMNSKGHKLTAATGQVKLFDLRWAYQKMSDQMRTERNAVVQQAAAVAGYHTAPTPMGHVSFGEVSAGADELQRAYCSVGVSFVKGWGGGNYSRASIKDTPCWIEIQLTRPLQILNSLLKEGHR
ncbi:unnamed protein product, partial [Mesorhabditis spiculigera]